jgi:hypothetical protein
MAMEILMSDETQSFFLVATAEKIEHQSNA